ncbi:CPBP family intramembrane metalloprotease [Mesorhizobium sp. M1005]|uniref:CPBP family intramembrane glutamic endopeptidase n=1 Tax=unclassified Mesorhizobium TaxID=325217 RepID=UPI0033350FB8
MNPLRISRRAGTNKERVDRRGRRIASRNDSAAVQDASRPIGHPGDLSAWSNIPAVIEILPIIALYAVFSGPLGEEPGWRGFATPRLLAKHSALAGSLILGAIWAIWHFPLGLVGDLSVYSTVNVVLAAVVFTWLYQNTGSVLLAILMHVTHQNSVRFLGVHRRRPCAAAMDRCCDLGGGCGRHRCRLRHRELRPRVGNAACWRCLITAPLTQNILPTACRWHLGNPEAANRPLCGSPKQAQCGNSSPISR